MRKSLGDKRREIPSRRRERRPSSQLPRTTSKRADVQQDLPTTHFGFRKITVERPLRLNFQASPERIARLEDERAFQNLAKSQEEEAAGQREGGSRGPRAAGGDPRAARRPSRHALSRPRRVRRSARARRPRRPSSSSPRPIERPSSSALSERDEEAEVCRDKKGNPEPDPNLRDTESVPLAEGDRGRSSSARCCPTCPTPGSTPATATRRTAKSASSATRSTSTATSTSTRPPRPLEEIEADIKAIEKDIITMLREVAG